MINNKQYIIMDIPFQEPDFMHVSLIDGKVLSYHKNLPIQVKMQGSLVEYCILGHAYQVDEKRMCPMEELKHIQRVDDIANVIESWAGCWLLIYRNCIFMDACGILGCFYSESGVISRSVHCINQALKRKDVNPRIMHRFGLDYYPGPGTPYSDIKRLMPSQTLCITDCTLGKRLLVSFENMYDNDEHRLEALIQCFQTLLKNFVKEYKGRIIVPVTGGYDSRTLIALLEYCKVSEYQLFTMDHDNISIDDKELPSCIAEKVGRTYQYIERNGNPDKQRYREYDQHCGRMAIDEDRNFYAYHQYPESEEQTALLRANIWECAWGKYYKSISSYGANISKFKKKYVNIRRRQDIRNSLESWFKYVRNDNQNIEFANRFYWEQRVGCWLSSVEQSLTVMENIDSIPLCNCNRILSILLGFDIEIRKNKRHQVMIIKKTCPELLEIPFLQGKIAKKKENVIVEELQYLHKCFACLSVLEAVKEERRHALQTLGKWKGKKHEKKN